MSLVTPMSLAAVACGADALMIEVHNQPEKALCDGDQSEKPEELYRMVKQIKAVAEAVGRTI
jgi:3-deoxy-7-phosphoheptulonate synthase